MNPDEFRDALARWPSGVTIVACRYEQRVVATTVSSFASLSLEPPLVLLALGAHATVLPFLKTATPFGVSILAEGQRRLATVFADPFPVGPDPFPPEGDPLIRGALVGLSCTVAEVRPGGDHAIIIASVRAAEVTGDDRPLVRYLRRYHGLRTAL